MTKELERGKSATKAPRHSTLMLDKQTCHSRGLGMLGWVSSCSGGFPSFSGGFRHSRVGFRHSRAGFRHSRAGFRHSRVGFRHSR
ncbi:hypothetical protein OAE16_05545, partial [Porticoccaceae bacterium]|nr:hypothetical protein [Porticoccaceae bacterium]